MNKVELILEYFVKVKASNKELTKKEAFKDLLNRLYSSDEDIVKIIDKMTLGAEAAVFNIPRDDKYHSGSADTLYNKIIIEFENNLRKTLNHAKEQLSGYLLGQFNSGEGYNFTLIASDFINWKVFAPDISCLEKLENLKGHELILNEVVTSSFVLNEENAEEFYFWIDRFLFKEEKQKATLQRIEDAFGFNSHVFIESFRELEKCYYEAKKFGQVQVSFEQWHKFLSIAYGSFDARDSVFLIHTYLSIFSKMLAFAVLSGNDFIDDDEMKGILKGEIFNQFHLINFVENDFFHWVSDQRNFQQLRKVFRVIGQEISAFDFDNIDEDILKGVYQELIDIDTRHALGEYYTPDWLCERIVEEFEFKNDEKILDPTCGSGSFLRAAVKRMQKLNPEMTIVEMNNSVYGIDIHPLSVQIAKTTVLMSLLSLKKSFGGYKRPIQINVILANTLLVPEDVEDLFGNEFYIVIDKEKYYLNTQILDNDKVFDSAIKFCEELADLTLHKKQADLQDIKNKIKKIYPQNHINGNMAESFFKIYQGLKDMKEKGRDSIWAFIIQNLYKPYFLREKFDYVIGNPPWFTYSSIKNEEYQNILSNLAENRRVKPKSIANFPHLEIASIFQAYCSSYFLNSNGKIAFVLPRSFISADQHDNSRTGKAQGFNIKSIWDLQDVSPLFNVPSCVFLSEKAKDNGKKTSYKTKIKGISFSGNLPYHNCHLPVANTRLKEEKVSWYYVQQGKSSAFSHRKQVQQLAINPYKSKFKQGATIVPRAFYFVELVTGEPSDYDKALISIKTSKLIQNDAKKPWRGIKFSGWVNGDYLFRTALSKSILPFNLNKPDFVYLPIKIKEADNRKKIILLSCDDMIRDSHLGAAKWFRDSENIWEIQKTQKSKNMTTGDRLDFQKGLSNQNLNAKYLVLYNSSAKDANATIVKRSDYNLEFIVESKAYVYYTNNLKEAYYLTSILNSTLPNYLMKDFQSKGLFGPRDIHKKILDVYFPEYDKNNSKHLKLSVLGQICHKKAKQFINDNPPQDEITPSKLGRLRLSIKSHLSKELEEIDKIVEKLIK